MPRYRMASGPETLAQFLEAEAAPDLKKLAALLPAGKTETLHPGLAAGARTRLPTRKADLVAFVHARLDDPEALRTLWGLLDHLQQAAVAEALHSASGVFDPVLFFAKYGQEPNWGARDKYGSTRSPSPLCLFFYRDRARGWAWRIPRDLKEKLSTFVPRPRRAEVRTVEAPPATVQFPRERWDDKAKKRVTFTEEVPVTVHEMERAAQHDLRAVLRLVDTAKVSASDKTKRATGSGVRAIARVLQGGDFYPEEEPRESWRQVVGPIRAFAWPLLLQGAGLANLTGTRLQLTAAGKKALGAPAHATLRSVWERWLKATLLDEFSRVSVVKGQTGKGARGFTAVADRRAAVVETLRACPPGQWIALKELSRFAQADGHPFEVHRNPWALYISEAHYGSLGYDGYGGWNILQERYMMAFLLEYAATLGVIDVALIHPAGARKDFHSMWGTDELEFLSQYDGLLHLRISPLGAWCLGLAEAYVPAEPEATQVLKVLPNLDVVATEPPVPADALFLGLFAEKASESVWRLGRARLLKALEEGASVPEIEAFLRAKGGGDLPGTVEALLREVSERASCLTERGTARLIEARDPALACLIANDSRLRPLCLLAGERHLVVPAESESAFRRALRELGYGLSSRG